MQKLPKEFKIRPIELEELDEGISDLDSNCSSSSFDGDSSLGEQSPAKSNKNDMDAIQERDSEYSQKDEDE